MQTTRCGFKPQVPVVTHPVSFSSLMFSDDAADNPQWHDRLYDIGGLLAKYWTVISPALSSLKVLGMNDFGLRGRWYPVDRGHV